MYAYIHKCIFVSIYSMCIHMYVCIHVHVFTLLLTQGQQDLQVKFSNIHILYMKYMYMYIHTQAGTVYTVPLQLYPDTCGCTSICRPLIPVVRQRRGTAGPHRLFLTAAAVFSDLITAWPCRYVASQVQSCWGAHHSRAFIITSATSCQASLFMWRAPAVKVEDFSLGWPVLTVVSARR